MHNYNAPSDLVLYLLDETLFVCFFHRYRKMRDQRDSKSHEAAIILTRQEQSTHHQQLTLVQQLKDTIGT